MYAGAEAFGALGRRFATLLARGRKGVNLVLAGRSPLDDARRAHLRELEAAGARVAYLAADVRNRDEVERLVAETRQRFGAIDGVIHAAGITRDARAARKSSADIEAVLATKAAAAVVLDEATRSDALQFFVLFSSVAGASGNLGQADYAYANAFLDELAATRSGGGRSLSIAWPLWEDGGLQVDDATRRLFERKWGMVPMPAAHGVEAFCAALASSEPSVVVVESRIAPRQETAPRAVEAPSPAGVEEQLRRVIVVMLPSDECRGGEQAEPRAAEGQGAAWRGPVQDRRDQLVHIVDERQSAHLRIAGILKDSTYTLQNGDLVFDRTLHGLRNTVLLPAGWEVSAVSQSGTIGTFHGRAFVALINLNAENNYRVTIHAVKRTGDK